MIDIFIKVWIKYCFFSVQSPRPCCCPTSAKYVSFETESRYGWYFPNLHMHLVVNFKQLPNTLGYMYMLLSSANRYWADSLIWLSCRSWYVDPRLRFIFSHLPFWTWLINLGINYTGPLNISFLILRFRPLSRFHLYFS